MRRLTLAFLLVSATAPALAAERSFPVAGFDRVANATPFDVHVVTGKAPSVHASGNQEALDRLEIVTSHGELRVGTRRGSWLSWGRNLRARIDVTVPTLAGASVSGPGSLDVDRVRTGDFTASLSGPGTITIAALEAQHADLHVSGPGTLTVSGRAASASVSVSGPGNVRATDFTVRDAIVSVSGPGSVRAAATGTDTLNVSGPGNATLTGGARCTIHKSFPGSASCS